MKKILFTMVLAVFALITTACTMAYGSPQYDPEYAYEDNGYTYSDDYAQVDWGNPAYDIQYSYYDFNQVFLVVYGNCIYIIPYDYFYNFIYPHFRYRLHWRSFDFFCAWWGYGYYNHLWDRWYYQHHRQFWHPRYNWYEHHKQFNKNRDFVIRKHDLRDPDKVYRGKTGRFIIERPRTYDPRRNSSTGERNFRFTPRSDRPQIRFHSESNTGIRAVPRFTPPQSPPPVVKNDDGQHKR